LKGKKVNARTRIRCPLCGQLVWQSSFDKAPYPIEAKIMLCKKSKGIGYGRNTFEYTQATDISFLSQVQDYLVEKISVVAKLFQLGVKQTENQLLEMVENQSSFIQSLQTEIKKIKEENKWLSSLNALTQTVQHGYVSMTDDLSDNQKKNVTTNSVLISTKS